MSQSVFGRFALRIRFHLRRRDFALRIPFHSGRLDGQAKEHDRDFQFQLQIGFLRSVFPFSVHLLGGSPRRIQRQMQGSSGAKTSGSDFQYQLQIGLGSVFPFSKHLLGRPLRGFRSQMQGDQGTAWGQPRAQLGHN